MEILEIQINKLIFIIAIADDDDNDNRIDGILCDPPYGIRAGARKTCSKANAHPPMEIKEGHIPRTEVYDPDDLIVDLLDVAADTLTMGGRITYLLPTSGK